MSLATYPAPGPADTGWPRCPLHEEDFTVEDIVTVTEGDPQTAPDAALCACPVLGCPVAPEIIR